MHRVAMVASLLAFGACASAYSQTPHGFASPPGYGQPDYGGPPSYGPTPGDQGDPGYPHMRDPNAPRAMRTPGPWGMPGADAEPWSADSLEAARRLYTVADTVVLRGAALCEGRVKPHPGLRAWSRSDDMTKGSRTARSAAKTRSGDLGVSIFAIARGGPAERAGLLPGDRILSINGETIPAAPGAMRVYSAKLESALASSGTIAFGFDRGGRRATAHVVPAPACDIRVVFANSPMINAATDGRSVMVMRGLVNMLQRDDELALVVGHELSHNVLGHFARGRALGHDNPFGPRAEASMREFEREADYVGLYFVALSGYDYESAVESSNRMSKSAPLGDRSSSTHPSQAERYAGLVRAAGEIRAKLAQGTALRPNIPTGRAALANTPGAMQ